MVNKVAKTNIFYIICSSLTLYPTSDRKGGLTWSNPKVAFSYWYQKLHKIENAASEIISTHWRQHDIQGGREVFFYHFYLLETDVDNFCCTALTIKKNILLFFIFLIFLDFLKKHLNQSKLLKHDDYSKGKKYFILLTRSIIFFVKR